MKRLLEIFFLVQLKFKKKLNIIVFKLWNIK